MFKRPLSELKNSRLQRLRENLSQYRFTVSWVPGKKHQIADALSRAPFLPAAEHMDKDLTTCAAIFSAKDPALNIIAEHFAEDEHRKILDVVRNGTELSRDLLPYKSLMDELRIEGEVLLVGERILVPRGARPAVLDLLHASHSGINKTKELASCTYVWPGMMNEVRNKIASCAECVQVLPSQEAEPVLPEVALRPMDKVSVDLCDLKGRTFIVMVDRYSGLAFVKQLRSLTTEAVWDVLQKWLWAFGYPTSLKSDNGPQFRSQFQELCKTSGILHITSSPYHPRSNGLAESAVKSVKRLIRKTGGTDGPKFRSAFLEWSSTPRADGYSPAEALYKRRLRTLLLSARSLDFDQSGFEASRENYRDSMVLHAKGRPLRPLDVGQIVHIQDPSEKSWNFQAGKVVKTLPNGRSYHVETEAGIFRRNRRHLRPVQVTSRKCTPLFSSQPTAIPIPSAPALPRRSERLRKKTSHI